MRRRQPFPVLPASLLASSGETSAGEGVRSQLGELLKKVGGVDGTRKREAIHKTSQKEGDRVHAVAAECTDATDGDASAAMADASRTNRTTSPRVVLARALAETLAAAVAAGDAEAAAIAHEAIGRLLEPARTSADALDHVRARHRLGTRRRWR